MVVWHAIALGILQGLTEFLPISSSGHLELIPWMMGWKDFHDDASLKNGFEVALHLGTLVGAVFYFRRDIRHYIASGFTVAYRGLSNSRFLPEFYQNKFNSLAASTQAKGDNQPDQPDDNQPGQPDTNQLDQRLVDGKVAWLLLATTIPTALVGAIWASSLETLGDTVGLVIAMLVIFGALLWLASHMAHLMETPTDQFSVKSATAMGLAQMCALIPGVSRSGVTITAGLLTHLSKQAVTRFSFLMGLPLIAGAGLFKFIDIGGWGGIPTNYQAGFIWGMLASAISSWVTIWGLMRLLRSWTFIPFAWERFILAGLALTLIATGFR